MAKLTINKEVLRLAETIVAEAKKPVALGDQPLPVVVLWYPRHGRGPMTERFVRVTEMNETHVKGFQIENEFDEEPGMPHTYRLDKVEGGYVYLLHLAKTVK